MKSRFVRLIRSLLALALLATAWPAQADFDVDYPFTAQRRPRIAVLEFEDTNAMASSERYGASVEAMLVTFLKRKTPFVVVERQKLGPLLEEWQRVQTGLTRERAVGDSIWVSSPTANQLLEKLDVIVMGHVTVLGAPAVAKTVAKPSKASKTSKEGDDESPSGTNAIAGPRIEIDVKLLSRDDGRIIAAAQRRGPILCLRSIVERLGLALEQEFLRPYYGSLKFQLSTPENVRIYLTPILRENALDEEKPPVEQSATVVLGADSDRVEPWTTDPDNYTVGNVLSGWYTMRLERPGYEGQGIDNSHWVVRDRLGEPAVWNRLEEKWQDEMPPEQARFLVEVTPLKTAQVNGDERRIALRRKEGSLAVNVKRQFLDDAYGPAKGARVMLYGGVCSEETPEHCLELNRRKELAEYADDATCDLFHEQLPSQVDHGQTYVSQGQSFDIESFEGGELFIEDYRGELLPVGRYQASVWTPDYQLHQSVVTVRDAARDAVVRVQLMRETGDVDLSTTGAAEEHVAWLEGAVTGHRVEVPLDFEDGYETGVPIDTYRLAHDIDELAGWNRELEVPTAGTAPPSFDLKRSTASQPVVARRNEAVGKPASATVKTRFVAAGRLPLLTTLPTERSEEMDTDPEVGELLDELLAPNLLVDLLGDDQHPNRFIAFVKDWFFSFWSGLSPAALEYGDTRVEMPDDWIENIFGDEKESESEEENEENEENEDSGDDEEEPSPSPEPLPEPEPMSPEELRALLAERLDAVDLLLLDEWDMLALARRPETAEVIRQYVEHGGSVYAFARFGGDYGGVLDRPFQVVEGSKRQRRLRLEATDGAELACDLKTRVRGRYRGRLDDESLAAGWDVLAVEPRRAQRLPRIVEHPGEAGEGYVMVWLESPEVLRRKSVSGVQRLRQEAATRAYEAAREKMLARYAEPAGSPSVPPVRVSDAGVSGED